MSKSISFANMLTEISNIINVCRYDKSLGSKIFLIISQLKECMLSKERLRNVWAKITENS